MAYTYTYTSVKLSTQTRRLVYWDASPLINVKVPTFQSYVKYVRDGSHNGAYVIGPIVLSSCSPTSRREFFALHDELHNKSFRVPNAISFFDSCDLKITVIIKSVLRLLTCFLNYRVHCPEVLDARNNRTSSNFCIPFLSINSA